MEKISWGISKEKFTGKFERLLKLLQLFWLILEVKNRAIIRFINVTLEIGDTCNEICLGLALIWEVLWRGDGWWYDEMGSSKFVLNISEIC